MCIGTTNVLALDMMRSIKSSDGSSIKALVNAAKKNLSNASKIFQDKNNVQDIVDSIILVLEKCQDQLLESAKDSKKLEYLARDIAYQLTRAYAASLLCLQANWSGGEKDWAIFRRFCGGGQEVWGSNRWLLAPTFSSDRKNDDASVITFLSPEMASRL